MISLPPLVDRAARVLVVGGDAAEALVPALVAEGYEIASPPGDLPVVEAVVACRCDLVLMRASESLDRDLEAIGDLRMIDEARLVPVVLFSDREVPEATVVRGLLAGADDFCAGPRERELLARVRVQLRNRRDRELLRFAQRERTELLDAAKTDPLTGLGNRRAADQFLGHALCDAESVLLMIIDIDHFKRVNDGWGHAAGDAVLRAFGRGLRRMARDGDQVARYGGEEFIVVIRDAPPDRHQAIAHRFLEGIRRLPMPDGGPSRVTASIGASSWQRGDPRTPPELFRDADEALYAAKGGGRDRLVCSWEKEEVRPMQTEAVR